MLLFFVKYVRHFGLEEIVEEILKLKNSSWDCFNLKVDISKLHYTYEYADDNEPLGTGMEEKDFVKQLEKEFIEFILNDLKLLTEKILSQANSERGIKSMLEKYSLNFTKLHNEFQEKKYPFDKAFFNNFFIRYSNEIRDSLPLTVPDYWFIPLSNELKFDFGIEEKFRGILIKAYYFKFKGHAVVSKESCSLNDWLDYFLYNKRPFKPIVFRSKQYAKSLIVALAREIDVHKNVFYTAIENSQSMRYRKILFNIKNMESPKEIFFDINKSV